MVFKTMRLPYFKPGHVAPYPHYIRLPTTQRAILDRAAINKDATAAQVIPRKVGPLVAETPISFPYLLIASTNLTLRAVAIADAIPNNMNEN